MLYFEHRHSTPLQCSSSRCRSRSHARPALCTPGRESSGMWVIHWAPNPFYSTSAATSVSSCIPTLLEARHELQNPSHAAEAQADMKRALKNCLFGGKTSTSRRAAAWRSSPKSGSARCSRCGIKRSRCVAGATGRLARVGHCRMKGLQWRWEGFLVRGCSSSSGDRGGEDVRFWYGLNGKRHMC